MTRKLTIALMLGLALSARAQNEISFSYASPDEELKCWGTGKAETYHVAIKVSDASLNGMKVTGISVPMPCANATDCYGFIARELATETIDSKKQNVVDLRADATVADRTLTATFTEPWVIDGDFYVGYAISVPAIVAGDEYTSKPIVYTREVNPQSFYLFTSRTYRTWEPRNLSIEDKGMCSALKVMIEGNFPDNSVGIYSMPTTFAKIGEEIDIPLTIINHGKVEVKDFDYEYDFNGKTGSGHRVLDTPLPAQFKGTMRTSLTLPACNKLGAFPCKVTITKINGLANEDPSPSAENTVSVTDFVPRNRPLVEEFTGTTCGWCPKGMVAMEWLNETRGDDFVGLAYHCYTWDPMCMPIQYPGIVTGLPSIRINRTISPNDPYFGNGSEPFGIGDLWDEAAEQNPGVAIDVESKWLDDDRTQLEATSYLSWAMLPEDTNPDNYRIQYVLVADGLQNDSWGQSNYLSGRNEYADMPGLDAFVKAAGTVYGLVYNDVPVLTANDHVGVKGSVSEIKLYEAASHSHVFDLSKVVNYEGKPIAIDKDKLRVVAFLLHFDAGVPYPAYGAVINACKNKADKKSSVESLLSQPEEVSTAWYDLNGRKVDQPARGLYIKTTRYTDGSHKSVKVMIP